MKKYKTNKATLALMLVLFIDGMGQGIIFPILTSTIMNPHTRFFFQHDALFIRNLWYGVLIAIYYVMWFISAPILGHWSDRVGRKKALMICLMLAAIGFLLSALAFSFNSLLLLILGRFIGGVTSGDQAIAKAAMIDRCPLEKKSIYIGLMLFAVTFGLVIGPVIGALLQNNTLVTWFSVETPFYFAFLLVMINISVLWISFADVDRPGKNLRIQHRYPLRAIKLFTDAITESKIRFLLISYFLTQLGWQMFYIYMPSFGVKSLNMTTMQVGYMLTLMGVGIGLGLGFLPALFYKKKHSIVAMGYSGLLVGNIFFSVNLLHAIVVWLTLLISSSLFGLAVANVLPLFSNRVDDSRQGWIMGVTGSIVALTGGLGALIAGFLSNVSNHFPFIFSSIIIFIGIVFLSFDRNELHSF